jgi:hypothetical protein
MIDDQKNNKILNIDRELEFINGIEYLKKKYGDDEFGKYYWKPQFYKYGFPIIKNPKNEIEKDFFQISNYLKNPREHLEKDKKNYEDKIDEIIIKTKFNLDLDFVDKELLKKNRASIYRYYVVGALNNISLSVSPKIKKKMKINFELFGAFYNTNVDYCGLFDDIENNSCNFNTFKLKPNMIILINPPYTDIWIRMSCKIVENIMRKNLNTIIYLVIPIWNNSDRKKLGLKIYDNEDLVEIDNLKSSKYLVYHKITNLNFYNGIIKKQVNLKDKIHLFKFDSKL